jgi:hypothetical protein
MSLRSATGALLVAIVFVAPLLWGSVHRSVRLGVFAACALALAATLVDRWRAERPLPITVPLVALVLATLATALQLVPLPAAVVGLVSPTAAELFELQLGDAARALSLDPPSTWTELAKLAALASFFAAASTFASRSARRQLVIGGVVVAATVIALIGFLQVLVGTPKLLFVYSSPEGFWRPHIVRGTFVNANHFGALLCVAAPAAIVLTVRSVSARARSFWGACAFLLQAAAMLTFMRATIACVLLGDLFALGFLWLGSRGRGDRRWALLAAGGVALGLLVAGDRLAPATSFSDLQDPGSRPQVWRDALTFSLDYPWTGAGKGAFEVGFTRYSRISGELRHRHVENEYLQAAIDLGWPVALGLVALAVWGAILAFRRLKEDPLAAGTLAGICALAVHQTVDFALTLPGVALPALAVLATIFGATTREPAPGRKLVRARPLLLVLPLVALAPALYHATTTSLDEDRAELSSLAASRDVQVPALRAATQRLRERHPADYFLLAVAAEHLVKERDAAAVGLLNQALYLNPRHPGLHLMVAELLADMGRKSQALLEYRMAAEHIRDPREKVWPRVLARYPALDDLLAATPQDRPHLQLLGKWLLTLRRGDDADRVYGMAVAKAPGDANMLAIWLRLAIERRDVTAARERLDALARLDGGLETRLLRVRVEILGGDLAKAETLADAERDRGATAFEVQLLLAAELVRQGQLPRARARLDTLGGWSLDRPSRLRLHRERAELERAAGNQHQMRWELREAERLR